jgi:zinc transporter ZupT
MSETIWIKLAFCFGIFFEAYLSGIIPTHNRTCLESPKIMGIANSFAAGVFIAIAFLHIVPEQVETWTTIWSAKNDPNHVLPLPTILVVAGYTLILIIDKVMFDTRSLAYDHHDKPDAMDLTERKFRENLKSSLSKITAAELTRNPQLIRKSFV